MSKLLEKLELLTQGHAQPMGFAAAATRKEKPRALILIASLAPADLKKVAIAREENVDALLFETVNWAKDKGRLQELAKQADPLPWGVRARAFSSEDLSQLQEAGCDFLVFGLEDTSAAIFNYEELGKFLEAPANLPEGILRTLSGLPLDGLFVGDEVPLTVQGILTLERLVRFADRSLMIVPPAGVGEDELELFRNTGVRTVVAGLAASSARDSLVHLREAIEKMEPEPWKTREKASAILPRLAPEPREALEEEEEEEEDV